MRNNYEVRGEVTAIFLTLKGESMETLIDTEDLEKAMSFNATWYAWKPKNSSTVYVRGDSGGRADRKRLYLHRFLFEEIGQEVVDHFNNNGLDNRRSCNLRTIEHAGNMQNREGATKRSKSGIRNVSWDKKSGKWLVCFQVDHKSVTVGFYDDVREAEKAAKKARANNMPYSKEATERRASLK